MASKNETVAEIVREMRAYAKNSKVNGGEVDVWNWLADYADRIEAAHKRALAAKDEVYEMLEQAAEVVERCDKAVESMHTQLMHLANEGKTTVDIGRLSKYFAHLENILRGDAGKEGS